jgi:protein-disulfide isomerase
MNKGVLVGLAVLVVVVIAIGAWISFANKDISVLLPGGASDGPVVTENDRTLGKADAPVTVVEYFSLGCPHCKTFHETGLPKLKAEYIDTGKVRFVFRDFPLDGVALAAAQLTRCVPNEAYFAMTDALFAQQSIWHVENGVPQIAEIAKGAGMDQAAFDACLGDAAKRTAIVESRKEAAEKFKVEATPTMFVNGRKLDSAGDYEALKAAIDAALNE